MCFSVNNKAVIYIFFLGGGGTVQKRERIKKFDHAESRFLIQKTIYRRFSFLKKMRMLRYNRTQLIQEARKFSKLSYYIITRNIFENWKSPKIET